MSDSEYRKFATAVGNKIDWNRRIKRLAKHLDTTIYYVGPAVEKAKYEEGSAVQLILSYMELIRREEEDTTLSGIIASEIRPTTEKSWCRYGDRNCMSPALKRNYLHHKGTPLDVQAQNLSITHGRDISPDDLVEFILQYEQGPATYANEISQEKAEISNRYKQLVGATLTDKFVLRFEEEFYCAETVVTETAPF